MEFSGGESTDGVKPEILIPLSANYKALWTGPVKTVFDTADHMLFTLFRPSNPLEVFLFLHL